MTPQVLPFSPRPLTQRELRRCDVHMYLSPKCARVVQVIGIPAMSQALLYEFNPSVEAYVERPRRLVLRDREIDITFWIRMRDGRERCIFLIPSCDSEPAAGGMRRHRNAEDLLAAGRALGVNLDFISESDVLARTAQISACFRLLPYVQSAYRMHNQVALREQICCLVDRVPSCHLAQVEQALEGFAPSDVRAVICDLIHSGRVHTNIDFPLHAHTAVSAGDTL